MAWLFQPLLMLLARSTDSQLARQVEFLHAENQMLRRRLQKRVRLTPDEKRLLVKLGQAIGRKVVQRSADGRGVLDVPALRGAGGPGAGGDDAASGDAQARQTAHLRRGA